MNLEDHRKRHIELHKALDELFADFVRHHPNYGNFLERSIQDLIEWSYKQTIDPTD